MHKVGAADGLASLADMTMVVVVVEDNVIDVDQSSVDQRFKVVFRSLFPWPSTPKLSRTHTMDELHSIGQGLLSHLHF
ncbi:hypothetical protein K443DRAFT_686355 [Laccaria amethystina LaAM-08-1]|uniref:Unplaced genomic scaffold K443scaffold_537, whole genome shotgun sequence n=1 Tax=Laccaria amethystina LaAM-08-1 TaxID=1095629 RepID=A0A0C9WSI5_9AGAR|nr:hypothetical protein K443DRAFT_686355 [Laccaria amethystina LaAM-08-1]